MAGVGIEESAHAPQHTIATRIAVEHGATSRSSPTCSATPTSIARHYARSDLENRRAALEDLAAWLRGHADAPPLSGASGPIRLWPDSTAIAV
jgi:hypothetical protein